MPTIFHDDFLLQSDMARRLYHGHATDLPILDYHNHLPPAEIAEDRRFATLTEIWLKGDHYKWRAMRALGMDENLITGTATDEEKFVAWAACLPKTLRNPLFHWSHLELKNYFGINAYLNEKNAAEVYSICNELLQTPEYSTQNLLRRFKVELLGTTDDPCDDLMHHKAFNNRGLGGGTPQNSLSPDEPPQAVRRGSDIIKSHLSKNLKSNEKIIMRPSFRPDKTLNIGDKTAFIHYLKQLEKASGINIVTYENLLEALKNRVAYFHENGCRIADHGLVQMPPVAEFSRSLQREFAEFVSGESKHPFSSPAAFAGAVLLELCRMYHERGWVQQFHLGPLRNTNSRLLARLGADAGVDSIGDLPQSGALAQFLDALDRTDQLAKTILYNINPADNEAFATMCGNFQDGKIRGKMQFGSGWWFLDQLDGMEKQINTLSNMGILSTFVGMTTDSRSFLSFPRHEYFRRVLCNLLGNDVERGLLPNDEAWLGDLVEDICYRNGKSYFN